MGNRMERSSRSPALFSCMVIVFVLLARGSVRARAWSTASSSACVSQLRSKSLTTRFSAAEDKSADTQNSDDDDDNKSPSTGWNHNQPSKENSSFWQSANGDSSRRNRRRGGKNQAQSSDDEPRTGWLHNTQPKGSNKPAASKANGNSVASSTTTSLAQRLLQQAMTRQERNHRIIAPPAFCACGNGRQVVVTEHMVSLPIDRSNSNNSSSKQQSRQRLDVYFSIVEQVTGNDGVWWNSLIQSTPQERAQAYVQRAAMVDASDMILYLQGGPGFGAPTPIVGLCMSSDASWAGKALDHYKRIVLMDQRGTGRSSPITKQTLEKRFPDLFLLDADNDDTKLQSIDDHAESNPTEAAKVRDALAQATEYMAQFRADSIVKDAEEIKDVLLLSQDNEVPRPWGAALGQSFGGFCMMTYLSQVDHPPKICLLTGGIAPMLTPAYDAYAALWQRVKERNLKYYEMYPGDIAVVKRIVRALLDQPAALPSGGKLTARRFLNLGMGLGGSPSSFASLHSLLSTAFLQAFLQENDGVSEFTRAFLKRIDSEQSFDDHPLYFLLHESIYADGSQNAPTNWAAHRVYESLVKTPSEFDYNLTSKLQSEARPILFFGEMVFPWMADGDFAELSGLGMRSLAQSLAMKEDWGPLYDGEHMQRVLADGTISKAAAALYFEDMYVDFDAAMKVTQRGGPLEKCKVWVTNEYQHSGLRDNGAAIFTKLHEMALGIVRTPS